MMKKLIQVVSLVLALSFLLAVPVFAEEQITPYASSYIAVTYTDLYRVEGNVIALRFEVIAPRIMQQIGVRSITLETSTTGTGDWFILKTFEPEDYSQMLTTNSGHHVGVITHTATYRRYYRACVEYYAKDSSGSGVYTTYSQVFYVSVV